jgi:hypothetical protein
MEIVSSAPSGRAFGVELKVHATPLVWIERTCHWQAAFHRDTLQSAVSKTRNVVEGILTLVFGLALVALVLAGVLEEILQPARRSYASLRS